MPTIVGITLRVMERFHLQFRVMEERGHVPVFRAGRTARRPASFRIRWAWRFPVAPTEEVMTGSTVLHHAERDAYYSGHHAPRDGEISPSVSRDGGTGACPCVSSGSYSSPASIFSNSVGMAISSRTYKRSHD